jgi:hypothetical protein
MYATGMRLCGNARGYSKNADRSGQSAKMRRRMLDFISTKHLRKNRGLTKRQLTVPNAAPCW